MPLRYSAGGRVAAQPLRVRRRHTPSMVSRLRAALAMAILPTAGPAWLSPMAAQAPDLELDHVYIVVQPGAVAARRHLRHAGLLIDSSVTRHDGQGTASVAAFFENAYLELLWVDSSVAVDSLHRADWADFVRAQAWRQSGASPFGVALHLLSGSVSDLPVPVRLDSASQLRPGAYYLLLRQPEESLATELFIPPPYAAVTSWLGRYQSRRPDLFVHPLGARRITRVIVCGPAHQRPRAATLQARLLSFEDATSPYLVIEFDGGHRNTRLDLRPEIPLVLSY